MVSRGAHLVAVLDISPRVAQKIIQDHDIEPDQVRHAVIGVPGLRFAWDEDPERGLRAMIKTSIRRPGDTDRAHPADKADHDDEWNFGSAYFIDG